MTRYGKGYFIDERRVESTNQRLTQMKEITLKGKDG